MALILQVEEEEYHILDEEMKQHHFQNRLSRQRWKLSDSSLKELVI